VLYSPPKNNDRRRPRVLALANQKGGVGKTTTAINLGTALAATHKAVLIVDLDPQGNASTGMGLAADNRPVTAYEVLIGEDTLNGAAMETVVPGLYVVPSTRELSGAEIELIDVERRERRLAEAVEALEGDWDGSRRRAGGRLGLCADRLSALAGFANAERARGRGRRLRAPAMRVFCA
jgi:Mrp family chromosome partitioning ATPase